MKNNKFLMIISVLLMIVMLIGATFSFFVVSVTSNNKLAAEAATFGSSVEIASLYTGKDLIPMDDSDVDIAYNDINKCVDIHGYGACQAYTISVSNSGDSTSYTGTIKFDLSGVSNLKYLLLDEDGNKYVDKTLIIADTDQSLGDTFTLPRNGSKTFRIIIWLSNISGEQNDQDAGGSFSAAVTYVSTSGSRVTGTFSGN